MLNLKEVPHLPGRADVEEFLMDNPRIHKTIGELTPEEYLQFYLEWNGIIGYELQIIAVMEGLGWKNPSKS